VVCYPEGRHKQLIKCNNSSITTCGPRARARIGQETTLWISGRLVQGRRWSRQAGPGRDPPGSRASPQMVEWSQSRASAARIRNDVEGIRIWVCGITTPTGSKTAEDDPSDAARRIHEREAA
jgi:hypothetical protein